MNCGHTNSVGGVVRKAQNVMRELLQKLFSFAGLELKLEPSQGEGDHVIVMKAAEFKVPRRK